MFDFLYLRILEAKLFLKTIKMLINRKFALNYLFYIIDMLMKWKQPSFTLIK